MILGIDPGLANTGWAVINIRSQASTNGSEYELVAGGVMKTKLEGDNSAERLNKIYQELEEIVTKYKVTEVAYESLFFFKNAKSVIGVAEAIGVVKLCADRCGLNIMGYSPLQVKMALVGYGRAEKDQVEMMVRTILGVRENIKPSHASDAVAVALTHAFTNKRIS